MSTLAFQRTTACGSKTSKTEGESAGGDICKDCYVFANRHRYLAQHSVRQRICEDVSDRDVSDSDDDSSDDNDADVAELGMTVDLSLADAASNEAQEERELMLMQAAKHVEMARAQRAFYQAKVADAVADATAGKDHAERWYTFVVITARTWSYQSTTMSSPASRITTVH